MKRSRFVSLGLVPAVAAWFVSCGSTPPTHQRICADSANRVVDDEQCNDTQPVRAGAFVPYHYYYMPYRAGGYPLGFDAGASGVGSTFAPPTSSSRVSNGRVVTGGFGSTAARSSVGS